MTLSSLNVNSCLSLFSYIKPQPRLTSAKSTPVVYLSFPTSNHNTAVLHKDSNWLFISLFLHQTTTVLEKETALSRLFISLFLHQTTTLCLLLLQKSSCLSLFSYIKPQLGVIYYVMLLSCLSLFSYIKPQQHHILISCINVVYLSFPTSNHNYAGTECPLDSLFISLFLHQTTTCTRLCYPVGRLFISLFLHQTTTIANTFFRFSGCLSLFSYIKPQPRHLILLNSNCLHTFYDPRSGS